jgi:ring-1,2-phenylacetyl-CoA epoxidase subunit PaaA
MAVATDEKLVEMIHNEGFLVENPDEMTDAYKKALCQILLVQADTELMSAPAYYMAACKAPSLNTRLSAYAIIQDELGHAHITFRLLEDLGMNKEDLIFGREPHEFKNPYGFDQPLDTWVELVMANAYFDRAGIVLLSDPFNNTSYGPWKRSLAKVDKEELFHLRHGEVWMKRLCESGEKNRAEIQKAADWMFPMGVEWFGMPDKLKRHKGQLEFKLKGKTNDQLRQEWLSAVVPLSESCGIDVPAHFDEESGEFVLDYHLPCDYDPDNKRWLFDEHLTWDQVFARWKRRGPVNEEYVSMFQRQYKEFMQIFNGNFS